MLGMFQSMGVMESSSKKRINISYSMTERGDKGEKIGYDVTNALPCNTTHVKSLMKMKEDISMQSLWVTKKNKK